MAGSIAPFWADLYTISHYIFTDSSGADYKLDTLSGGRWTSKESVYVSYEPTTQRLYFRDGSFWVMGCESLGSEPDAGTRYPTLMQDTNGNQIKVRYHTGAGAPYTNSSARIKEVEDVRAVGDVVNGYKTYTFTYNTDSTPHLTQILGLIGTGEVYVFSYLANQNLQSPFGSAPITTQAHLLTAVTNGLNLSHTFEYVGGAGEMSKMTLPYGAYVKWAYQNFTYNHATYGGSRTVREVNERRLAKSAGATEQLYVLYDDGNSNNAVHSWMVLRDPNQTERASWFSTDTASWTLGLQTADERRNEAWFAGQIPPQHQDFTWAQDGVGNPYLWRTVTTLDMGAAHQKQMKTEQIRDSWGNVTESKIFDFGNLSTPARTQTNTYLGGANYTSRHIYNRLWTSSVNGITLVTNTYDGGGLANVTGLRQHDTANYGTGMNYRGNVTQSTSPGKTSNMGYDITGTAISGNDGQGHTMSATMSGTNNYAVPSSTTVNGTTQNLTWNAFNGLTQQTGANSEQITIGYDGYARPSNTTSPHGAGTTFTYTNSPPTKTATTNGKWVKTTMDGLGRTIKTDSGYSSTTVSIAETEYDSCACSPVGKMKRVSQPYAPGGTVNWTTYTYDGMGRTLSVAQPGGSGTTTYVYEGNTTKVTDPAGKWKKYVTDAMGNLVQVVEPYPVATAAIAVYNTGVTGGGLAADGATDTHYTLVGSPDPGYPGPAAKVVNSGAWPIPPWLSNGPNSKWIGPRSDAGNHNSPGTYTYRTTFDLTGLNPATAVLTGQWATDDGGTIRLNGATVVTGNNGFGGLTPFTINSNFVAGVNTLEFVVTNDGTSVNPTGLRVEISGSASSPGGGADYLTNYTYDSLNHLTQVSMPRPTGTQVRTFNYNATTQRLTSTANPENGTVSYTYNADGTVQTKIDAKNQKVEYIYDANARVTQIKRYPVSTGSEDPCQGVTFTYGTTAPSYGRLVSAGWGGPSCAGGHSFGESYTYTAAGLILTKSMGAAGRMLTATYTYDNEGKMTSVKYPTTYPASPSTPVAGPMFTYTFDNMGRPNKLTDDAPTPADWAKDVIYGVASEMTQIKYWSGIYTTETRQYNAQLQMTRLTAGTQLDMQYIYSATQNNGRITQQKDWVSGEEVSYTYDSLQRLATAATTSTAWGLSWTYDGFGNRTGQSVTKGAAPAGSWTVDAATNRLTGTGYAYDANGNQTLNGVGNALTYDIENRLLTAGGETYSYAPDNKRVWKKKANNDEEFYFYGLGGQKLGTYKIWVCVQYYPACVQQLGQKVYFGGKLISDGGTAAVSDRLGSRRDGGLRYFPYGEEQSASGNEKDKFGTYYRDATGLDYADQRFYASTIGRFLTPDPYRASGGPSDPSSWNRYSYTRGDPVNRHDPRGLMDCPPDDPCLPEPPTPGRPGGPSDDIGEQERYDRENPPPPLLQGTAAGGQITTKNVTREGLTKILEALDWLQSSIDSDCLKWLQSGGTSMADQVSALVGSANNPGLIGHGGITSSVPNTLVNAVTSPSDAPGFAIVINANGAFYQGGANYNSQWVTYTTDNGRIQGGTFAAQTFILLHELAHSMVVPGFLNDAGRDDYGRRNNDTVRKNCDKTLKAARR